MISNQKNIYPGQRSVRTLPYLQFRNAKWIVSELVANMPPGLRRHMLDERLRVQNLTKIFDYSLPQIRPEAIQKQRNNRQYKCKTYYVQLFSRILWPSARYQDSKVFNTYRSLYWANKLLLESNTVILELLYPPDVTGALDHLSESDLQVFRSLFFKPLQRCLRYILDFLKSVINNTYPWLYIKYVLYSNVLN